MSCSIPIEEKVNSIKLNTIKEINNISDVQIKVNIDQTYIIKGWIKTVRSSSSSLYFCKINDGSTPNDFQIILNDQNFSGKKLDEFSKRTQLGSFLKFIGKIVSSPAQGQKWEMIAEEFEIIGEVADNYPLSKGKINLETLRNYYHLRPRTNTFGSVFRLRSQIIFALHQFLQEKNGFLHIDPNVLTINECEGGAGVFPVPKKLTKTKLN